MAIRHRCGVVTILIRRGTPTGRNRRRRPRAAHGVEEAAGRDEGGGEFGEGGHLRVGREAGRGGGRKKHLVPWSNCAKTYASGLNGFEGIGVGIIQERVHVTFRADRGSD